MLFIVVALGWTLRRLPKITISCLVALKARRKFWALECIFCKLYFPCFVLMSAFLTTYWGAPSSVLRPVPVYHRTFSLFHTPLQRFKHHNLQSFHGDAPVEETLFMKNHVLMFGGQINTSLSALKVKPGFYRVTRHDFFLCVCYFRN